MAIPNFDASVSTAFETGGVTGAVAVLDNATLVVLLSAEAASFTEASTNLGTGAGKKIAQATIVAGDWSLSGTGFARKIVFGGKTGGTVGVAGPANPTVIAFLDGTTVLAQLSETGSATFSSGDSVTFPAIDVLTPGPLA